MIRCITAGCIAALVLLLGGCASPTELPPQTVSQLTTLRGQLADAKVQLANTTKAARDLYDTDSQQVQPPIDRFNSSLTALNNSVVPMRSTYQAVQTQSSDYFANWEQQLNTMSPSVAEAGRERRTAVQADFDDLKAQVRDLRAAYVPYDNSLQEVSRYLATDPTPSGVKAMRPALRQAIDREPTIRERLDRLMAKIDDMRGA